MIYTLTLAIDATVVTVASVITLVTTAAVVGLVVSPIKGTKRTWMVSRRSTDKREVPEVTKNIH